MIGSFVLAWVVEGVACTEASEACIEEPVEVVACIEAWACTVAWVVVVACMQALVELQACSWAWVVVACSWAWVEEACSLAWEVVASWVEVVACKLVSWVVEGVVCKLA